MVCFLLPRLLTSRLSNFTQFGVKTINLYELMCIYFNMYSVFAYSTLTSRIYVSV
jgi:hypothetical protein